MRKMKKDYKYMPFKANGRPEGFWCVYVGSAADPIVQTTCKSEAEAKATADCLNFNPNFFDRIARKEFRKLQGVNI